MKVAAIIAEYNPFHNGHKYHIEQTKKITNADYIIAIISGNYVQRGEPAIIDKYSRTQMALECGVDLILELPTCFAISSAEYFAYGAVSILNKLGIVDYLCFGSECHDLNILTYIANILFSNPTEYKNLLNNYLKEGLSFPKARENALIDYIKNTDANNNLDKIISTLKEPNNILGIEYIKSLLKLNSSIKPITIQRKGEGYNSNILPTDTNFSSASGIRNCVLSNDFTIENIKEYIPINCHNIFIKNYNKSFPIDINDFSQLLYYALNQEDTISLSQYLDIDNDIANKMLKYKSSFTNATDYINLLKSKNITYTRISRSILHLILNLTDYNMDTYLNSDIEYVRILGFKNTSSCLLKNIKKSSSITIISKLTLGMKELSCVGQHMLNFDINCCHLYNQIIYWKYNYVMPNEYKQGIKII